MRWNGSWVNFPFCIVIVMRKEAISLFAARISCRNALFSAFQFGVDKWRA